MMSVEQLVELELAGEGKVQISHDLTWDHTWSAAVGSQ
jgi:hypothetical protein